MDQKFEQPGDKRNMGNLETKKFAFVLDLIPTHEQRYLDPKRRWAHNDLYPASRIEVVKIENDGRVLLRDGTGEFWVPGNKLEIL